MARDFLLIKDVFFFPILLCPEMSRFLSCSRCLSLQSVCFKKFLCVRDEKKIIFIRQPRFLCVLSSRPFQF